MLAFLLYPFYKFQINKNLPQGFELIKFSNNDIVFKVILKVSSDLFDGLSENQKKAKLYEHEGKIKQKLAKILHKKQRDIAVLININGRNDDNKNETDMKNNNQDNIKLNKDKLLQENKKKENLKERVELKHFGKVIGVSSCKGGVGKSSISYALANLLAKCGKKVAFLDLDIYGPSAPSLISFSGQFEIDENKKLIPIYKDGVYYLSVGFVAGDESGLVWRGAMIDKIINSLIFNSTLPNVDITIVDMPPGTGDAYLSFFNKFISSGVVLVSTDSNIACVDLKRSISAFKSLDVKILGCVQNMSDFFCDDTLLQICNQFNINILDSIPLIKPDKSKQQGEFLMQNFAPHLQNTVTTLL